MAHSLRWSLAGALKYVRIGFNKELEAAMMLNTQELHQEAGGGLQQRAACDLRSGEEDGPLALVPGILLCASVRLPLAPASGHRSVHHMGRSRPEPSRPVSRSTLRGRTTSDTTPCLGKYGPNGPGKHIPS